MKGPGLKTKFKFCYLNLLRLISLIQFESELILNPLKCEMMTSLLTIQIRKFADYAMETKTHLMMQLVKFQQSKLHLQQFQ